MKISIIGYTGFIGSYLIKKFSKNIKINKINLRKINIRKLNKNTIKKIFSSKIIINCAASLNPRNDDDFFLNEDFLKYLLVLNKKYNRKIIHLSSINVLIKDRLDTYSLTKKKSEKKVKKNKNLVIIRLPFMIIKRNNIMQKNGNVSRLFNYLQKIILPVYPMIYPGHLYQPLDVEVLKKKILKLIYTRNKFQIINLYGDKKISLWNIFSEIAINENKKIIKINLSWVYKIMPNSIKKLIKRQNNFLQHIAAIDHSKFK